MTATAPSLVRVPAGDPRYFAALDFLVDEAEVLDENRLDEWLTMLDDQLSYRMPVRVTQGREDGDGFVGRMAHFDDDRFTIELRVRRLDRFGWAEDPPSRTKRLVTNLRVHQVEDDPDALTVRSYLLLLRPRGDSSAHEVLAAERRDVLVRSGDRWRLRTREIRADQTSVGTMSLLL